jgi:hypothetical protein
MQKQALLKAVCVIDDVHSACFQVRQIENSPEAGNRAGLGSKARRLVQEHRKVCSPASDTIAGLPDEKNKGRDQASHDKHPVLALETQNGKMLDQELHRRRPLFMQDKRSSSVNILFIYLWWAGLLRTCEPLSRLAGTSDGARGAKVRISIEVRGWSTAVYRTHGDSSECRRAP